MRSPQHLLSPTWCEVLGTHRLSQVWGWAPLGVMGEFWELCVAWTRREGKHCLGMKIRGGWYKFSCLLAMTLFPTYFKTLLNFLKMASAAWQSLICSFKCQLKGISAYPESCHTAETSGFLTISFTSPHIPTSSKSCCPSRETSLDTAPLLHIPLSPAEALVLLSQRWHGFPTTPCLHSVPSLLQPLSCILRTLPRPLFNRTTSWVKRPQGAGQMKTKQYHAIWFSKIPLL